MAQSKELVLTTDACGPEFVEQLLPCSQKVSLLYNLSYLYLGKFPNCERLLRMRALETQLLFGSSEAVLMKCVGTSENLVWSLFPKLKLAVEKNKPALAEKYLDKARDWITDIIEDVDRIIKRYDQLNEQVDGNIIEIIAERAKMERASAQRLQENEEIKKKKKTSEGTLEETRKKLAETEQLIENKNRELQNHVTDFVRESKAVKCYEMITVWVIFSRDVTQFVLDSVTSLGTPENIKNLQSELGRLSSEKTALKEKEWGIQVQITDWQMQLAKLETEQGFIPYPVHLERVQHNLSKIQNIFIKLKRFWEKVHENMRKLSVEPELKGDFLKTIEKATEVWGGFGVSCGKAVQIFRVQSTDAYRFLEIDPSSLTQDVWKKECDSAKKQLKEIRVSSGEYTRNQITQPKAE